MNSIEKKAEINNQKHCTELEYQGAQSMTYQSLAEARQCGRTLSFPPKSNPGNPLWATQI